MVVAETGEHTAVTAAAAHAPQAVVHGRDLALVHEVGQAVPRDHSHQAAGVADVRVVQPQQPERDVDLRQLRRVGHLRMLGGRDGWKWERRVRFQEPFGLLYDLHLYLDLRSRT